MASSVDRVRFFSFGTNEQRRRRAPQVERTLLEHQLEAKDVKRKIGVAALLQPFKGQLPNSANGVVFCLFRCSHEYPVMGENSDGAKAVMTPRPHQASWEWIDLFLVCLVVWR